VFGLGLATKIHVAVEAVDMRKGFEGLYGLVRDQFGADPLSGHLFLFSNRTRTRLKALVWDGSGDRASYVGQRAGGIKIQAVSPRNDLHAATYKFT
jgi:transposase